ncbi:MAG TPA: hypothetical protein VJR58_23920, partial [Vineibacter sp.]|nr:hypothetical protein [Vineibacter sp.]
MRISGSCFVVAGVAALCLGSAGSFAQSLRTPEILRGCRDIMNTIPKEPKLAATCFDVVRTVLELGRDLKTTASCPPAGADLGDGVSAVLHHAEAKADRV